MASLGLGFFVAAVVSAVALMPPPAVAQLRPYYYAGICPNLEVIVRSSVKQSMAQSPISAPAALRLFFHDCAVRVRTRTESSSWWLHISAHRSSTTDHPLIHHSTVCLVDARACRAATRRS